MDVDIIDSAGCGRKEENNEGFAVGAEKFVSI